MITILLIILIICVIKSMSTERKKPKKEEKENNFINPYSIVDYSFPSKELYFGEKNKRVANYLVNHRFNSKNNKWYKKTSKEGVYIRDLPFEYYEGDNNYFEVIDPNAEDFYMIYHDAPKGAQEEYYHNGIWE